MVYVTCILYTYYVVIHTTTCMISMISMFSMLSMISMISMMLDVTRFHIPRNIG